MAQNKYTPSMTIKHAKFKFDPFRVEYETYINNRTGKKLNWVPPTTEYAELFLEFLENERPEVLASLQEGDASIAVWDESELINGRKEFFWTNVELMEDEGYRVRKYCTNEIDRNRFPKINPNHRNDNEL